MKGNGKFSLALHALGHLARAGGAMTSDDIARHNGTHPVVVRRVLGLLRAPGIVASEKGHAGGWRLARPAAEITVADVYLALGEPFLLPPRLGEGACAIEAAMADTVAVAMADAEAALLRAFAGRTIADLAAALPMAAPPA